MNIRFLETVIWLSELRNFRSTAARLNMTPAAISNRIGAVEQELGFRLFERDARDVKLTAEGSIFVDGAREVVHRYNNILADINPGQILEGTLRIGIVPSLAITILPYILDALKQRHPRIRISVTTASSKAVQQMLEQHELDIIFALMPEASKGVRIVDICTFGMYWIGGKNRPYISNEEIFTPEDLLGHPVISYESGSHNYQQIRNYFSEPRLRDATVHYSNSLSTTINMIAAGIGISVIPPVVIQKELRAGELQVLKTSHPFPPSSYSAAYLESTATGLTTMVSKIAREAGAFICSQFDRSLAYRTSI